MKLLAATCTLTAGATLAVAGPLNPEWIAADAQWVLHVDVDALRGSTIGRIILNDGQRLDIDLDELDEFTEATGLDPRKDIMSVTAYGTSEDFEEDAVLIAVTTGAADEALERLMEYDEVRAREIEADGHDIVAFRADDERAYLHLRRGDARDERIVVMSKGRRDLVAALDVIDGDERSLSLGRGKHIRGRPSRNSIIFVAASGIDEFGNIEPASEILALSEGFVVDLGEDDGELTARATLSAHDDETAQNITAVVNGMVAFANLAAHREPELEPLRGLARAINVEADDREITVKFRYDTRSLIAHIEEMEEHDDDEDWDDDDDWDEDDDD